jgi:hypothetical protein
MQGKGWTGANLVGRRNATVALVHQIEKVGAGAIQVRHNQLGDLSVRVWLRYLTRHADLESKRIRLR